MGPTGRRVRLESEKVTEVFSGRKTWCRRGESNPHESHPSPDFESGASANSATPAPGVASIAD